MTNTNPSTPNIIKNIAIGSALMLCAYGIGSVSPLGSGLLSLNPANAEPVTLEAPQMPSFADVVEAVSPAVVSVRVEAEVEMAAGRQGNREFRFDRRFFEDEDEDDIPFFRNRPRNHGPNDRGRRHSRRHKQDRNNRRFGMSQGSGFFVSEDGYIVTNNHVISKGSKITIVMHDGTELEASLIGADKRSDLAVLKVKSEEKFTYVSFDDKNPRIGDWVVAVGNPFGLGGTVTAGIVSANGREISSSRYDDFIQIDAAVNKGNSGGPAFNLSGKVVGVNTAIFSPSGGNVGIAFAIPASTASQIVEDLMDDGEVMRGWLGVQIQPVTKDIAESIGLEDAKGAIVASTQENSPAKAAGIKPGDVITSVDGNKIKGPRALARQIGKISPNSDTTISIWRDGVFQDLTLKLGKLKDTSSARINNPRAFKSLARIGLELRTSPDGFGVEVVDVVPGSNAAKRGIQAGDKIVSINGEEVTNPDQVLEIVTQIKELKRKAALFQIRRDGDNQFIAVPLRRG